MHECNGSVQDFNYDWLNNFEKWCKWIFGSYERYVLNWNASLCISNEEISEEINFDEDDHHDDDKQNKC